jgi:peptidoglycan/xylan/chitin deacetylase (PgdA/CDA1 family)
MINYMYRTFGNLLSPRGQNARLSILIYHRVLAETDSLFPAEVTVDSFDAQLAALKNVFTILPLSEAVARLKSGSLPARAACITFDDGYLDNASLALPVLQRHGLHATFFIATAYLNGGRMFNDTVIHAIRNCQGERIDLSKLGLGEHDISTLEAKRQAIDAILKQVKYLPVGQREDAAEAVAQLATDIPPPTDLMMEDRHVQMLAQANMEIGGHTSRHPILAKLDTDNARREIVEGKDYLEGLLKTKLRLFAYPNGKPVKDYLPEQADIVRSLGFEAAVSTHWATAGHGSDIYQLPRFTPYSEKTSRFIPMLLQNLTRKS